MWNRELLQISRSELEIIWSRFPFLWTRTCPLYQTKSAVFRFTFQKKTITVTKFSALEQGGTLWDFSGWNNLINVKRRLERQICVTYTHSSVRPSAAVIVLLNPQKMT